MKPNKYIVVVEVDGIGYISKAFDNESKASILFGILTATFANYFFPDSRSHVPKYLKQNNFKEYIVNGNSKAISKSIKSKTDGKDSLHLLEINPETFCIKSFISERENHSNLLNNVNSSFIAN